MDRYRHAYLLAALVLIVPARPFLVERVFGLALLDLMLLVVLIACIVSCARGRWRIATGLVMVAAIQALDWLSSSSEAVWGSQLRNLLAVVFFGYVAAILFRRIFQDTRHVTTDTLAGAISIYLVLGVGWTFAYALLEVSEPGSFVLNGAPLDTVEFDRFIGFSFITLTTLGYGNMVPTTPRADALAVTEAIVGPIYLTVLVARLVALNLTQNLDAEDPP
ncbi:MAG: potassium channel family protein [Proteobacteria bacterium]|nr:potassium channel family protein [Pseudomonadota bacterium]